MKKKLLIKLRALFQIDLMDTTQTESRRVGRVEQSGRERQESKVARNERAATVNKAKEMVFRVCYDHRTITIQRKKIA